MVHVAPVRGLGTAGGAAGHVAELQSSAKNVWWVATDVVVGQNVISDRIDKKSVPERDARDLRIERPRSGNGPSAIGGDGRVAR